MNSKLNIVVTGAHCGIGQSFLRELSKDANINVVGFITPWAPKEEKLFQAENIKYIRCDLNFNLPENLQGILKSAQAVIHLAWQRGPNLKDVINRNLKMVEIIMENLADPSRFIFISSVAASPKGQSNYGISKFTVAEKVREKGGAVVALGLVVDNDPTGGYKMLVNIVSKTPFAFRTKKPVSVLPIQTSELVKSFVEISTRTLAPDSYGLFSKPVELNKFLEGLEAQYKKSRLPFSFDPEKLIKSVKLAKKLRLMPWKLNDKILTFFCKDQAYLERLRPISLSKNR